MPDEQPKPTKSSEELAAEVARLKQANDDLKARNKALSESNVATQDALDVERASRKPGDGAREPQPQEGTPVCYVRGKEAMARRGKLSTGGSDGAGPIEIVRTASGPQSCGHIEYGEPGPPDPAKPEHTFETTRPYDKLGRPDTFHLPEEGCPFDGDLARCPWAKPAKATKAPQAP